MRRASQRPFISNLRTILLYGGQVYHSNGLSLLLLGRCVPITNFLELRYGEVRRNRVLRRWVNSLGSPATQTALRDLPFQ
jgi:hypothetical protein